MRLWLTVSVCALTVGVAWLGTLPGCASDSNTNGPGAGGGQSGGSLPIGGGGIGGTGGSTLFGGGGTGGGGCVPTDEVCDGIDNNCDGATDEGCPCIQGETQPCYSGDPALVGIGECKQGQQICDLQGVWGDCQGEVLPTTDVCNGLDDDCDGATDEDLADVVCGLGICQVTVPGCLDGQVVPCVPGPSSPELCDGVDNNCDGTVDEGCSCVQGQTQACYTGAPATRGIGQCHDGLMTCDAQGHYGNCTGDQTPVSETCNQLDDNCDGVTDDGDPGGGAFCSTGQLGICAQGQEHCVSGQVQCVAPSPQPEICNGLDDDCDGAPDDGDPGGGTTCATGQPGICAVGTHHCLNGTVQCVAPTPVPESCNGQDDDCDNQTDEGDPGGGASCSTGNFGVCAAGVRHCQGGGLVCVQTAQPSAETCDGLDNDCDNQTDEGDPGGGSVCTTGQPGVCSAGVRHCQNGQLNCVQNVQPSTEICDNQDNNCNGQVDEGDPGGGVACSTGGLGVCSAGTRHCQSGQLNCVQNVQSSAEICDNKDNDCDGATDEGDPGGGAACNTGLLGVCAAGTQHCVGGVIVCQQNVQPSAETCDGKDNNCNGQTDEGDPGGGVGCSTGLLGVCNAGTRHCQAGVLNCVQNVQPSAEICDNQDNNCNGQVDEGDPGGGVACSTGLPGVCGPGTRHCQSGLLNCVQNVQSSPEICDNKDNNCNGSVDEGNPGGGAACNTGLPGPCANGVMTCSAGALGCAQTVFPVNEVCGDAIDNNCNGAVDEGCVCNQPHDKCTSGTAMISGCGSDPSNQCVTTICASDSFCCDNSWDSMCVGEVYQYCASRICSASQGSCAHTLCTAGTSLSSGCDASYGNCVSTVCSNDSWCCSNSWDSFCVSEISTYCSQNCN